MTKYNKRSWLNPEESPSTGNIVCYDGINKNWDGNDWRNTFISISDCHCSARLHIGPDDTVENFINKLEILSNELQLFIKHLKENG